MNKPRTAYFHGEKVDLDRLERPISSRFLGLRERLHDLHRRSHSIRSIARELGRAPSTISRELRRDASSSLGYVLYGARPLRDYVVTNLQSRRSPERISHRLCKDFSNDAKMRAATETIYQAIYTPHPAALQHKITPVTRYGRTRRKPRRDTARRTTRFIDPMVSIALRPSEADGRRVPGHWEGDLIVGNLNKSFTTATNIDVYFCDPASPWQRSV